MLKIVLILNWSNSKIANLDRPFDYRIHFVMAKQKFKNIVYSTNPDFQFDSAESDETTETPEPKDQNLYVSIDRKQRAGKEVTLIEGFVGNPDDLKELGSWLKSKCGVGGSVKDGDVLIQGNFRDKVYQLLLEKGYRIKKKGG